MILITLDKVKFFGVQSFNSIQKDCINDKIIISAIIFFCIKLGIFQLHLTCWNYKKFFHFFWPEICLACFLTRTSTWCIDGFPNKNLIFSSNYGISCSSPLCWCIDQKSGLKKSQATFFCINIPCKKLRGNKTVCFTIACFITSVDDQKPRVN